MNITIKLISIIAGILIGILIIVQFKTATPLGSSYPVDLIEAQKELIKDYIDEENAVKSRIVSLRKKIDENLEKNQAISQTANLERLNELKKEIGLTAIEGDGYIIKLDDSPFINREIIEDEEAGIVYASDIRDVVNLLRAQHVKGIAINDQRIIATSSITSVGNTVLVNNSHLAPPFYISAIGEYESLVHRLEESNTLTDLQKRVKENGIQFDIQKASHIILPIYNGQFRLKYIQSQLSES
jgi:uncharacterized protein YlxW (UPF0749 family)